MHAQSDSIRLPGNSWVRPRMSTPLHGAAGFLPPRILYTTYISTRAAAQRVDRKHGSVVKFDSEETHGLVSLLFAAPPETSCSEIVESCTAVQALSLCHRQDVAAEPTEYGFSVNHQLADEFPCRAAVSAPAVDLCVDPLLGRTPSWPMSRHNRCSQLNMSCSLCWPFMECHPMPCTWTP